MGLFLPLMVLVVSVIYNPSPKELIALLTGDVCYINVAILN